MSSINSVAKPAEPRPYGGGDRGAESRRVWVPVSSLEYWKGLTRSIRMAGSVECARIIADLLGEDVATYIPEEES